MKIVDVKMTNVAIPFEAPKRESTTITGSLGVRSILEVSTDAGIIGLGEVSPHEAGSVQSWRPLLVGHDPYSLEELRQRLTRGRFRDMSRTSAFAGIEMACLDIQGRAVGRPVYDLLGGKVRDRVPMTAYLFYRLASERFPEVTTPEQMVAHAKEMVGKCGMETIQLKAGFFPPEHDIATTRALRATFPRHKLRVDPNGIWSVETAVWVGCELLDCHLEWLEDPAMGLAGMAAVRERLPIPLATNMCVVDFDHIGPAVAMKAVDVILCDLWRFGGIRASQHLATVCDSLKLGLGIHAGLEFGVGMAAKLHGASVMPNLTHAMSSQYHQLTDDIIQGGMMAYEGGCMRVPGGPGLGVRLDEERMALAHERYERMRESGSERTEPDPDRPGWYPIHPAW